MLNTNDEKQIYLEAKKKVDRYSHDAFFHYMLTRHDNIRKSFCQWMIPDYKLIETTVINGEYYPMYKGGKKLILDILAKDESGHLYNIEMQCYDVTYDEIVRFQLYAYRALNDEMKKGMNYSEVKPLRQMIINNEKAMEGFANYIHHFTMNDNKTGNQLPHSLYEIFLIQPQYLDMEKINIEEFDEFMYLFKNDQVYDKIEVHKNVQEAVMMHEEYLDSRERIAAIEREREEMIIRTRETRIRELETRVKEGQNRLKEGETRLKEGETRLKEGETRLKEGETRLKEGETRLKEGETRLKENLITLSEKLIGPLSQNTKDKIAQLSIEQLNEVIAGVFDITNEKDLLKLIK